VIPHVEGRAKSSIDSNPNSTAIFQTPLSGGFLANIMIIHPDPQTVKKALTNTINLQDQLIYFTQIKAVGDQSRDRY
jgi:hypothetical protein